MSDTEVKNDSVLETEATEEQLLDKLAYTKKRYLSPKEIAAYVLVNFGQKNLSQFINAEKQFFLTQFAGLSGKHYANINLFSTIYDAVDDTLSGLIIDRTRTRWGRVRPFFILPLPLWILGGFMLFSTPSLSEGAQVAYVAAATIIYGLGMSYFNAWNLMIYNITPNINERNNLITITKFFELFGTWLPSFLPFFVTLLPKISPSITNTSVYKGFAYFMLIFSAAFAVFGFFNMRERVPLQSREEMNKTSVWGSMKNIITNRPLIAIILSDFFNSFKAVGGSTESYFWLNNTGNLAYRGICGLFTGLPNYLMVPFSAKLVKKFGARTTAIAAGLFGLAAYILLFVLGYPNGAIFSSNFEDKSILNLIAVIVLLTVAGLPNKVITVCNPILTADALDYMEWKHGLRNEALVTTVQGYGTKLAGAITGWLSGMVLHWINYVPLTDAAGNAIANKDPGVLRGIWVVFCVLPALARGLYGLSFILYPIHGELQQRLIVELAEKRAAVLSETVNADK